MNNSETCIFILDGELNLVYSSEPACTLDCWHGAMMFQDNRLIGIPGLADGKFLNNLLNGNVVKRTILLRPTGKINVGRRLLLKITPLFRSTEPSPHIKSASVCLEIQDLGTIYSTALKKVAKKYDLTKTETLVLKYLMMGLSTDEIKNKLMIGTPTLRTHQQRLRHKTGETSSIKTILTALNPENHADDLIEIEDL